MSSGHGAESRDSRKPIIPADMLGGQQRFRVVLESIRSELETSDSFAIKFSLLTKAPLPKIKHLMTNLPVPIWSGTGRSRAERILALVEEAGAVGSIVEVKTEAPAKVPVNEQKSKPICSWCGFPLRDGDTHCGFCMTPVGEAAGRGEPQRGRKKRRGIIPPKRLLCYAVILIVEIAILIIIR
jgi:hypothetical protein